MDYHCLLCSNEFDLRRGEEEVCPYCNSTSIERIIGNIKTEDDDNEYAL